MSAVNEQRAPLDTAPIPPQPAAVGPGLTGGRVDDMLYAREVPGIVKAACTFAAARNRPAAVFVLARPSTADGLPDEPITKFEVSRLVECLDDTPTASPDEPEFDQLDLIVQSSGGDIHGAFQMMSCLRKRVRRGGLVVCVPSLAQSSATLLCLGGDAILLDDLAALGPLDAQICTGLTEVGTLEYSSALHLFKGLTRLQELSREALWQTAAMLYDKSIRRNDEILRSSIEFARAFTAPLFERIESHKIGYWDQMLRTGEEYGRVLLGRGDLVRNESDSEKTQLIQDIVRKLVYGYASHEYVIDCDELVDGLHLNAARFDTDLRFIARDFRRFADDSLVMVVRPDDGSWSAPAPEPAELSLHDWPTFCRDSVRHVVWRSGDKAFHMTVGVYGRRTEARNPWRGSSAEVQADDVRYFAGDTPTL